MNHVVLLGDSIFDNAAYVPDGPPVIEQLRALLPDGWRATLLAVDGDVINDVMRQVADLPADASHLVVSVGGNDALGYSTILEQPASTTAGFFAQLAEVQQRFRRDYGAMLDAVVSHDMATAICTIYDAVPFPQPEMRRLAETALPVVNDIILREGIRHRLPVIDLREVCSDACDYSEVSPIEPSETGGAKIAQAISRLVTSHPFDRKQTVVFTA
jgi:hypothetical protein